MTTSDDSIERLAKKLTGAPSIVVFTGAGISTESGISDYRSKGGLWERFQPIYFDEFMASESARIEYWRRKCDLYDQLKAAVPNPGHRAVADLYQTGRVSAVITQNIDGLHQKAGLPEDAVIELHGNTTRVRCMTCDRIMPLEPTLARIRAGEPAPACDCGGHLKPDTISFGQSLREKDLSRAMATSAACDLFLAVGSTLIVQPAALMPDVALRNGACLAIINLSETPYDGRCHLRIEGKAGEILPAVVRRVGEMG